ncbi:outer membrane protein [Moorella thermoacetica Y72]|uniref:Outer membrane protein n=1 Tax=Moorella thermoacetica Y72 TaxID=1325331 RepID=A0A0S6UAX2_NEOTH|nr:outer membrane protein [Moorella thermoacetica Y72]
MATSSENRVLAKMVITGLVTFQPLASLHFHVFAGGGTSLLEGLSSEVILLTTVRRVEGSLGGFLISILVILDGFMQGIGGQVGTVHLLGRQPVQGLGHGRVADFEGLFHGLALDHFCDHTAGGNGGPAAEGFKFDILDNTVFDFDI